MDGSEDVLHVRFDDVGDRIDLSRIVVNVAPTYVDVDSGITLKYTLSGFGDRRLGTSVVYPLTSAISPYSFENASKSKTIYAAWCSDYIVKFDPGVVEFSGSMPSVVVPHGHSFILPESGYESTLKRPIYTYYSSDKWAPPESPSTEEMFLRRFSKWDCTLGGVWRSTLYPGSTATLPTVYNMDAEPVVRVVAQWEPTCYAVNFKVDGDPYCSVLIDRKTNLLVVPDCDPVLRNTE